MSFSELCDIALLHRIRYGEFITLAQARLIYWRHKPKPQRSTISMAIAACYP